MSQIKPSLFSLQNVLCIRTDNMGDLLMSTPALRALKETFGCKITVLTSKMGSLITPFIPEVDDTIVANVPWVKTDESIDDSELAKLVQALAGKAFDAAIIFTVYSQNSLPAALLSFMAGIKIRIAYCRENPYQLITHWIPDEEPYSFIQHQVERDLKLTGIAGAFPSHRRLSVCYTDHAKERALSKLQTCGVDLQKPFLIFHSGVSEEKRKYPVDLWIQCGKFCLKNDIPQIVITGSSSEKKETEEIQTGIGKNSFSVAGLLSVEELIAVIDSSQMLVSVNTGTIHIAAALQKPVVVLYALTNPQHTPWQTASEVLYFSVKDELRSKNEVVKYVSNNLMQKDIGYPSAGEVLQAIQSLLNENQTLVSADTFS